MVQLWKLSLENETFWAILDTVYIRNHFINVRDISQSHEFGLLVQKVLTETLFSPFKGWSRKSSGQQQQL